MADEYSFSYLEMGNFECPVCGSGNYQPVIVARPNGGTYRTEFYECAGCTTMFRDPKRFRKPATVTAIKP